MRKPMDYNQYQQNNKLFITGVICLVLSLSLIFFSLYIAPNLIWDLNYDIPDFIVEQISYFQDNYEFTTAGSKFIVWLFYFILGLITGMISLYISQKIDHIVLHDELHIENDEEQKPAIDVKGELKESAGLGAKIILLMVAIIVVIFLLQEFVFYTTPPAD